ncbi:hypothetical protein BT96DRAFT_356035 [Gymnopus androsaceus JB14]|uniref:Uncharacterized protein n=1 Tax=Gymnopus androsaceus JB14 TaxID=1447944 RepID=A0A6A4GWD6_9AGAR|nr:hypothetical protein BT96DRAFT_356035 [Gymnopus androsaceus JB14]
MDYLFFDTLPRLKDLQILHLTGGPPHDVNPLPNPVIIPHLHTMEVRSRIFTPYLLDSVNTPNLQVLAIGASLTEEVRRALPAFVARSRCRLRAFSYFEPGLVDSQFLGRILLVPLFGLPI